ncbi:MAG: tetratricopeptide repeat protein [Elusimicrobiota bacterium]|nr:tetratricopeptide repeat protein [Endomicrobiia bacterium]MDW8165522.1 tetratricopeptide repeat protein [Elusimicrobiota bacterium]
MKRIIISCCLLTIVILGILLLSFLPKSEKIFFPREGETKVLDETKINNEIEVLSKQLSLDPNNIKLAVELGIYYFIKGPQYYDKAINLLYDAWELGSTDTRIFYYLGCMYEFLKLYELSAQEYIKFLNNFPQDIEVLLRLGNVYYKQNKIEEAKNAYKEVLKIDKNNIVALANLGYIFLNQDDYLSAQEYFIRVIEIVKRKNLDIPRNINFYLGKIFYINKNFETAKIYFEREKEKYPDNTENTIYLAKTYYELKNFKESYSLLKELIEIFPQDKELRRLKYKIEKLL